MILASQSPRRIELMREAGYDIRVIPADIDETPFDGEAPLTLVERLARAKAAAVAAEHAEPNELTVAADTIVTFDGQILGKPADGDEARTMLRELSGRTHQVATGVCIVKAGDATAPHAAESLSFVDVTDVTFYELTEEQIERYVASGEPMDKAGAYGVQNGAAKFVAGIEGCYFNVNTPKTEAGNRQVPMLDFVKEAFVMEKERQELLGVHCEATIDGYTDFIFLNRFGQPQHQSTLNKAIRRIIRDCNDEQFLKTENPEVLLPHFSCHSLRHTFTTRMCEAGVNIKVIQDTLGHKDITTTLNIYTDVTKELKRTEFDGLDKYFNNSIA